MAPNTNPLSIIGKASRVLVPNATWRRFTRRGTAQKSQPPKDSDSDASSSTEEDYDPSVTASPTSSLQPILEPTRGHVFLPRPPLVEDTLEDEDEPIEDEDEEAKALDRIMARARELPTTWYYSSNHVMVNRERAKRVIAPLVRMVELDEIAREHAEDMAEQNTTFHSDASFLRIKFRPAQLGQNVAKGGSIREIHKQMMITPSDTKCILDMGYTRFGMATAKASDGELFICQIFLG
jgi:hypothetical protein